MSFSSRIPSDLEGLVSWVSSIPSALTLFLPPLLRGPLSPERRALMETSHLGLSILKFFWLCVLSGCRFLYLSNDFYFLIVCMCEWLGEGIFMWVQVFWRPEDCIRAPGAGIAGICQLPREKNEDELLKTDYVKVGVGKRDVIRW